MRLTARKWRWMALGLLVAIGVGFVTIRTWVVPVIIARSIHANYAGKVDIGDWWFNWHSAGLSRVILHEGPEADSPEWLTAEKVEADVSIASILRGRFRPTRVTVDRPRVKYRVDAQGKPITRIPLVEDKDPDKKATPLPEVVIRDARVDLQQEGREPMVLTHADGKLSNVDGRERLEFRTNDPNWGRATLTGDFDSTFKDGKVVLSSDPRLTPDPAKLRSIPFIPSEVWANVDTKGPAEARVTIDLALDSPKPVHVLAELTLKGTDVKLPALQVESTGTTGSVIFDDGVVQLRDIRGRTVDGSMEASGKLDFTRPVPHADLDLRLKDVDVTKAPKSWQLGEMNATGRLSGRVNLKADLAPKGVNLSGTRGEAVIEDGSVQGIPVKSVSVGVKAEGDDLRFETPAGGTTNPTTADPPEGPGSGRRIEIWEPVVDALPIIRIATRDRGLLGWAAFTLSKAVEYQVSHAAGRTGRFQLPKTITSRIELEDVDLAVLAAKAAKFGVKIPVPVAGRFSLKAEATIPIGSLRDLKAYAFKGDARLEGASIDHVDVGQVVAHLELVHGVLVLSDLRGQFVDHPSGDSKNPPARSSLPAPEGELTPGGFRGTLRASISPRGPLIANLEGRRLPLGELLAPVLPLPTPVSGELTLRAQARGHVAQLGDPKSWEVDTRVQSRRITYRKATIDEIDAEAHLKSGQVELTEFAAKLAGQPLKANGTLEIGAPYRFDGQLNAKAWEVADVLAFVPSLPRPAPASGKLDVQGHASGTLFPRSIDTRGAARLLKAQARQVPLGAIVFQWRTNKDALDVFGLEAFSFGGKVSGEVRVPLSPGSDVNASLNLKGIDAARLSALIPRDTLSATGRADGTLRLTMPLDASSVVADALLTAPGLTIREKQGEGLRIASLRVTAKAARGQVDYEATAESLGARVRFQGSAPIVADLSKLTAQSEFQAAGFRFNEAWRALGISGGLAELDGLGAVEANIRTSIQPFRYWSRGVFELRNLRYGRELNLGGLRGTFALTPTTWRIDGVNGELLGGVASGEARGESSPGGSKQIQFDFKVNRASLARMLAEVPSLAKGAEGYGSLRAAGQLAEELRATAELQVPRARVLGLAITDLRVPTDIELSPLSGIGTIHARHWVGSVGGGTVRGTASLRLGEGRSYQTETQLNALDLEVLSRTQGSFKQTARGKLSGKIVLNGGDLTRLEKTRGRVDLDLSDASLVELPVFKELDRFLGASAGGGLFEEGHIQATVANKTIYVEAMTLQGRIVQVHSTGTVTFDGGLDLEVLVNTRDIIPQSGLALVALVPGLGQVLGRGEEVLLRLASFLENRLLKFRVGGTVSNPSVRVDAGVAVTQGAAGFFSSVFRIPIGGRGR